MFARLADGPATRAELGEGLGLKPPALHDFLDALVALGLLERRDGGRYANTAESDFYLVPGKRYYMGHYLTFVDNFMRPTWDGLAEMLRTGKPPAPQARRPARPRRTAPGRTPGRAPGRARGTARRPCRRRARSSSSTPTPTWTSSACSWRRRTR
ncbi:methyltransferase dimerization domain-containing protein [Actinomadura sp. J1-007]|uniref:methyltransferase family protein n=1 Tax=Actinomadura sp. J1-007 TaxID=2661913 RepID=UPI001368D949|nr:methyltransferase dimerization domain-containing protein [Actinomadura sp. J1-007]